VNRNHITITYEDTVEDNINNDVHIYLSPLT
jgi:hypothetical protein